MNHNISPKKNSDHSAREITNQVYEKDQDLQYLMSYFKTRKNNCLLNIVTEKENASDILALVFKKVINMGFDQITLEKIRNSCKHKNVSFAIGDTKVLPFKECTFDTIICRYAANYFKDPAHFLCEIERVLEDQGLFILIDNVSPENKHHSKFYNYFEKRGNPNHHCFYKKSDWVSLLERKGLRIQSCLTYERQNNFYDWCSAIGIPGKLRLMLTDYILLTSKEMQGFFNIKFENQIIKSFSTESVVLICRKINTFQNKVE